MRTLSVSANRAQRAVGGSRAPLVLMAVAALLVGRAVQAEQLPITHFTTANGLAHNRVGCIVQDSHGFMWFCTPEGLSRFDGHTFVTYGVAQGLPYPLVNDVLEAGNEYWIATNGGGVVRFAIDQAMDAARPQSIPVQVYRVGETVATNSVNVLFRDRAGRIWAGTDGGLFRLDDASAGPVFRPVSLARGSHSDETLQVWGMVESADGSLWIGTKFGLIRRAPDGRVIQHTINPPGTIDHIWTIVLDDEERVWIGHNSGLIVYRPVPLDELPRGESTRSTAATVPLRPRESATGARLGPGARRPMLPLPRVPGEAHRYTADDGLPPNRIYLLMRSAAGTIWIGGAGLGEFRQGRFRTFTRPHGLDVREITGLAEDRGGNIWLGTIDGAMRVARDGFLAYGKADGLGQWTGRIFERDGAVHVVSDEFRITRLDGSGVVTVRPQLPQDLTPWRSTRTALVDSSGDWWVGTRQGIYRFPRVQRFEDLDRVRPKAVYTVDDGLADNDVTRLFEDRRGDIWIAHFPPGDVAVTRWERTSGRFHRYSLAHGLRPFNPARVFAEDSAGNIWVGFIGGDLMRYAGGRFEVIVPAEPGPVRGVTALHHDRAGRLWVGAYAAGLMRIDDPNSRQPRMTRYSTSDGLASNNVLAMTEDRAGHIYVAHGVGIDRLNVATGQVKHYDARDGIISTDFVEALCAQDGELWFSTAKGLLRLLPPLDAPPFSPRIRIGEVRSAGSVVALPPLGASQLAPLVVPPGANHLQIGFFGLAPDTVSGLRYQYRLDGADRDWSPATTQRGVTYANLRPGRYTFQVRAITADGTTSDVPAALQVTVLPHFWQQWWFIVVATVGVTVAVYAVYRYRVARLLELERIRTRLATDLHDDIGSGLSQVAMLSELARRRVDTVPAAVEPLSAIGELSRDLVDSMSDIVWAINPRRDHLSDMTHRMRRFASDLRARSSAAAISNCASTATKAMRHSDSGRMCGGRCG